MIPNNKQYNNVLNHANNNIVMEIEAGISFETTKYNMSIGYQTFIRLNETKIRLIFEDIHGIIIVTNDQFRDMKQRGINNFIGNLRQFVTGRQWAPNQRRTGTIKRAKSKSKLINSNNSKSKSKSKPKSERYKIEMSDNESEIETQIVKHTPSVVYDYQNDDERLTKTQIDEIVRSKKQSCGGIRVVHKPIHPKVY